MEIKRPLSRQPIPKNAKRVFEGDIFDVYQWQQELYDGNSKVFEKLKRDDTVAVIPVLPGNKLLLIEDQQPGRDTIITFPGGRVDEGEDPFTAVKRELLEETGYSAGTWELWKAYQPVTKIDWVIYLFIARDCVKSGDIHLDAGEKITPKEMTLDEVIGLVKDPRFLTEDIKIELTEAKYDAEARKLLEKTIFG